MRFDLTDLRLFLLVAERGSITHGAELAGLALASASARIKGMEERLGAPLLERRRRGVVPTAAGQALLHHARAVQNQIEAMAGDLRAYAGGLRARVRLMANTAATAELLRDILPAFLVAHPGIDIDLDERPSHEIAEAVASGAADLGIAATWAGLSHLEQKPFFIDRLVVIVARNWPGLAGRHSASLADMLGESFVGLSLGHALQEHINRQAARLGRHLHIRIRVPGLDNVCRLVAQGAGIAIVPESAARRSARTLRSLRLSDDWATRQLNLCARSFDELTPQAKLLAAALAGAGTGGLPGRYQGNGPSS
ncbi:MULTISPECIES: LysR substrate-binding domain-containing protein [Mesorhizobium]|uniref:LysR family transcriptional regulator n=2 Tax=Mesorhizobium TaxID=68287 RepID=A0A1A5HPH3_RHILI|nr:MULTISPECIES: LysR substrate-binding domain-containing protein [Mesorhizobium]MBE1710867.1 LysR family transcriptional regulator [Mesorhizobium japonicum]MBE1715465.1 LysR family transcriptional regulator [Mesorhizobium japonicum]MUT23316.1 LysR family transcriptional regulator [Mesorhizobium japonicum]MUT29917.1 LysR family transcriptional regulator [Mesorhizobium japonicum]OBP68625.1 LysR family transcriptional regulator [Mesorhizobium loti]